MSVRKATPAEIPRLAAALAAAFADDPVIAWVFPNAQRRRRVLPGFMELRLRRLAFPHDEVWAAGDGDAVAAWFSPPGTARLPLGRRLGVLLPLMRFIGPRTPAVLRGLERMEERHPVSPPHWYLFLVGTEPAAQGRGLASALLSDMLARADADGLPACLESSSERNLAFYARHGFEVTGRVTIPGGPMIWPMWREAR
jgi:ribosomal protein S18 acetylase RimI-like enzyme